MRAVAGLPQGVHAVSREQATELIRTHLAAPRDAAADESIIWLDVSNPGEAEAAYLRDEIGLHPLAVEDCLRGRQRPKLDRYPGYFFLVVYAAAINPDRDRMALNELHVFLGERFLITVHDHKVEEVPEVIARWRASPGRMGAVGTLAHALLDAVVDDYFPVLEHFAERADQVESAVFASTGDGDVLPAILVLRHELVLFRRIVAPQRDVLSTLLRRDLPFLQPDLMPYLQDVHDHTLRVTEEIDALRELLSALLDAQFSTSATQLNRTVRMLTAWSIILMSMTLVAGIYGMNFRWMPELEWRFGYAWSLALMLVTGLLLILFFRRRNWL